MNETMLFVVALAAVVGGRCASDDEHRVRFAAFEVERPGCKGCHQGRGDIGCHRLAGGHGVEQGIFRFFKVAVEMP